MARHPRPRRAITAAVIIASTGITYVGWASTATSTAATRAPSVRGSSSSRTASTISAMQTGTTTRKTMPPGCSLESSTPPDELIASQTTKPTTAIPAGMPPRIRPAA